MSHLVDAYGDLAPVDMFETDEGLVDAYGDPVPEELWTEECEIGPDGTCIRCGSPDSPTTPEHA